MSSYNIATEIQLQTAIGDLRAEFKAHGFVSMAIKVGKKRSLSQNDISHAWYEQISRELREDTPLGVKSASKLNCGIPILRAEDADFRDSYDRLIRPMPYENKVELMKWFPVTSVMTKAQLSEYLEAMQKFWGERGVMLEFPQERAA